MFPVVTCRVYARSRHLELQQLKAVQRLHPSFDVAFFAAHRLRQLKQAEKAELEEGGEAH